MATILGVNNRNSIAYIEQQHDIHVNQYLDRPASFIVILFVCK